MIMVNDGISMIEVSLKYIDFCVLTLLCIILAGDSVSSIHSIHLPIVYNHNDKAITPSIVLTSTLKGPTFPLATTFITPDASHSTALRSTPLHLQCQTSGPSVCSRSC
jgi:hypothetical protein